MISTVELCFGGAELEHKETLCRLRRSIRDKSNPLEIPDGLLNKEAFIFVLQNIEDSFESFRTCAIPPVLKLASALRFFADGSYHKSVGNDFELGLAQSTVSNILSEVVSILEAKLCSYQKSVGNDFELGLAQSTVSNILSEVVSILEAKLCPVWISTRMSEQAKEDARNSFYLKSGFPGVISCVDGTHIGIVAPAHAKHHYLNRKGYFSINAMIACDHNMTIRFVDARFPRSSHESFIWSASALKVVLERMNRAGELSSMYLGDSGYPLRPYLMTPFRNTIPGSREAKFNKIHVKGRNIVERTIGVLKSRFRCLLNERKLHYSPKKLAQIINSCCALHNICKHFNVPNPPEISAEVVEALILEHINIDTNIEEGVRRRQEIMLSL